MNFEIITDTRQTMLICQYLSLSELHCRSVRLYFSQQSCPCLAMCPNHPNTDLQTDFLSRPQNHRNIEVGKDLLLIRSTLLKQDQLKETVQNCPQLGSAFP